MFVFVPGLRLRSSVVHQKDAWHVPSEATTKFGVRNFVASFQFRISRQLIRFSGPGVTDLFVCWISLEKYILLVIKAPSVMVITSQRVMAADFS